MDIDNKLWEDWKKAVRNQIRLSAIDTSEENVTIFEMRDKSDNPQKLSVRHSQRYSVGCDIVGYSRRSLEGQLYLTTTLFAAMEAARDALRTINWLLPTEPLAVLPTGDGALLVTSNLQTAFAFVMALNMFIEDLNRGPFGGVAESVERTQGMRILPCEVRYVIASGRLVEIKDVTGRRNYIGDGLVTCARILAASKGAHLLVEENVMAEFLANGGINEVARMGNPWNWKQNLHYAHLQARQVKSGNFSFYNVFGNYNSAPFLSSSASEGQSLEGRTYSIGSHDVTSISGS